MSWMVSNSPVLELFVHHRVLGPVNQSRTCDAVLKVIARLTLRLSRNQGRAHHNVRTEYCLIGPSFVTNSRRSTIAWAIRIRSNGSLCNAGSDANAVT